MNEELLNYLKNGYGMNFECKRNLIQSLLLAKDKKIIIIDTEAEYNENLNNEN